MDIFGVVMLSAITLVLIVRGFAEKAGFLRFPFLLAVVTAGWFIPQAIGLLNDNSLPSGGFGLAHDCARRKSEP